MLKLSIHHGVVKLLDYFDMKDNLYLILDTHTGGNLRNHVISEKRKLGEKIGRDLASKIA